MEKRCHFFPRHHQDDSGDEVGRISFLPGVVNKMTLGTRLRNSMAKQLWSQSFLAACVATQAESPGTEVDGITTSMMQCKLNYTRLYWSQSENMRLCVIFSHDITAIHRLSHRPSIFSGKSQSAWIEHNPRAQS